MCGFPFAPIQILTGDIREGCQARHSRLHDVGRSLPPKSRIERRFESLPGVQRFANLWGTPRSFRTSEKNKIVLPRRELRGSANLDSARRNGGFARTKLKPFSKGASRFCKPRISPPKQQLPTNKIKTFPKGRIEVLQTSNQRTKHQLRTNRMKSSAASRLLSASLKAS